MDRASFWNSNQSTGTCVFIKNNTFSLLSSQVTRDVYSFYIALSETATQNRKSVTRVGTFEVSVPTYVALRMFIMQVLASQLHFLANRNAELAIPPLFWPVNCIKIGGHVALLSGPAVYSLYCDSNAVHYYIHNVLK